MRLTGGLVVDVGANVGKWTAAVLRAEPAARVLAVEPNGEARSQLEARFGGDSRIRIDSRAVSSAAGTVAFHLTGHTVNASLFPPRPEMQAIYGGTNEWEVRDVVDVEATTLDELTDGVPVSLLKIDVQGAETEVLAGASSTLARTAAVLLEVLFVPHYEGGSDFADVHRSLREHGFVLAALSRPFATERHPALWADACYVPRPLLERH